MVGIIGHMSGGKSYYAVEKMLDLLGRNHTIVTNITLNCQAVTSYLCVPCVLWKRLYYFLSDDERELALNKYHVLDLRQYDSYPCGSPRGSANYDQELVYVFLDEASSVFDSMITAASSDIVKVATWARHTRKRGIEVVLLMQFPSELNKRLRVHIVEYVHCNNSNNIRIPVIGMGLPAAIRNMSIRQRYASDLVTPIGDASWVRFRPEIYRCYNTAQIVVGHNISLVPHYKIDYSAREEAAASFRLRVLSLFLLVCSFVLGVFLWLQ